MKKIILVVAAVIFLMVSLTISSGGNMWRDSSNSSGDEPIGNQSSAYSGGSSDSSRSTSKQGRPKEEAMTIFNEASSNHGERPHLEILARRYDISVDEVIDIISMMVDNGEINMERALTDRDTAREALDRLHKALQTYSQKKQ